MKYDQKVFESWLRVFHHHANIVRQYSNTSYLYGLMYDVVPKLDERLPVSDRVAVLARWFKSSFMSWSTDLTITRYTDVETLLKTRTGRCGEWAILFGAMLNASGIRTRLVVDYSDHVWNEFFLYDENRWVMVDCTLDNIIDQPYQRQRSGKEMSYVIAFEPNWVEDVTSRYVVDFADRVRKRRKLDPLPGYILAAFNRGSGALK